MQFDFACASRLYQDGIHPRILFGPKDVGRLRALVRKGTPKKIMDTLRARVRPQVEWILDCPDLAAAFTGQDIPRGGRAYSASGTAREMATVAVIDRNADCAAALSKLLGNTEWLEFRARMSLPHPLAYDIAYDMIDEAARANYRRLILADTRRRIGDINGRYYRMPAHNITLGAGVGSIWGLLAVLNDPEVGDLADETARVIRAFEATMNTVYGEDGYPEEDMGYGTGVGGHMSQIAECLRRAGLYDPYEKCPRYAKFGRAVLHFVQPWGEHLSTTGDHGDDFGGREFVLPRMAAETNDPTLTWLLETLSYGGGEVSVGRGRQVPASTLALVAVPGAPKPVHPARADVPTAFRDRSRGLVSFRSGWRDDDALVVFDGSQRSPAGQGHGHASCGHFSFSALGEYFAVDTGRYNLEQNCHSVVLVDGKSGRSTDGEWVYVKHDGILTRYEPGEFVDFAAVDASHQYNTYWARRNLGLVKGRGATPYLWVVDDINKNNDVGEYWWQLHTCPENVIKTGKTGASIRGHRHGNWLDVHWVLPLDDDLPDRHKLEEVTQDEATPSSYKYIPKPYERVAEFDRPASQVHYSTFVRPRLIAKVSGWNGRFMSLMVPRAKGEKKPKVKRLPCVPGSLAAQVTFEDVEDTVIFAYEHGLLEAGDVVARGHWCVVRRSRKTGRVLNHALADGTSLKVAGKTIE